MQQTPTYRKNMLLSQLAIGFNFPDTVEGWIFEIIGMVASVRLRYCGTVYNIPKSPSKCSRHQHTGLPSAYTAADGCMRKHSVTSLISAWYGVPLDTSAAKLTSNGRISHLRRYFRSNPQTLIFDGYIANFTAAAVFCEGNNYTSTWYDVIASNK